MCFSPADANDYVSEHCIRLRACNRRSALSVFDPYNGRTVGRETIFYAICILKGTLAAIHVLIMQVEVNFSTAIDDF